MTLNRTSAGIAAMSLALLGLLAACGGGEDSSAATGGTVRSVDGVLTVQVPEDVGVEVEVELLDDSALPSELTQDGLVVLGYELSPDGAEFAEPLPVEFRLDPAQVGLDLAAGAVPVGLLLTRNEVGDLESIGATFSRDANAVLVRGRLSHFSPAFLVLSKDVAAALVPDALVLAVGERVKVTVVAGSRATGARGSFAGFEGLDDFGGAWSTRTPFLVEGKVKSSISVFCTAPTGGIVVGAFSVIIKASVDIEDASRDSSALFFPANVNVLGIPPSFELAGTGSCSAPEVTDTPERGEAQTEPVDETAPPLISLTDPAGDGVYEESGEPVDSALDITGAEFMQDGDEIVVMITFDGNAAAYHEASSNGLPFSVQFRLKEGGPFPEVFHADKNTLKVSGGLLQVVSYSLSGKKLTIRLTGRTLEDVEGVRVATFVFEGGTGGDEAISDGYSG